MSNEQFQGEELNLEGAQLTPEAMQEAIDKLDKTDAEIIAELPDATHEPADIAAMFFTMNEKKLRTALKKLSAKQTFRMVMAVASYPLIKNEYLPKTDEERAAAYLFNEMTFNKNIMQLQIEAKRMEEAMAKEQETNISATAEGVENVGTT